VGFITSKSFDPKKQADKGTQTISLIEERYKKLNPFLRKLTDEILSQSKIE
jgi:hypothetical protein